MKKFFKFFANQPLLAMMISIGIILLGASSLFNINRDMFPTVDFGEVVVTTAYSGASAEDVEINVTNKLEKELGGLSGIKRMTSYSQENRSLINLVLDPDTKDQDKVKKNIRQAIDRVTNLPEGVIDRPTILEISNDIFPVIEVGVLSNSLPYKDLRKISRQLNKKLKKLKGVARTDEFGFLDREIKINVSLDKLKMYQLSLNDVVNAIKQRNIRATSGTLTINDNEKIITTLAQFKHPEDVKNVIIRSNYDGQSIRVKDIATISNTFEDSEYITKMNGEKAISFRVYKSESADIIKVVARVKALLKKEQKLLPQDVSLKTADDSSYYVNNRFNVVVSNGILGIACIILVLCLFFNLKTSFWIAMGIPISVFGVIFLLPIFGQNLNVISLMAIIIVMGIIVDDAIIVAENIARKCEEGMAPLDAAVDGIQEVFKPVITTILTTFIAFAPMFFMSGIMGKFIFVIPLVITLALLISLIECSIALPAHLIPGLNKLEKKVIKNTETNTNHWFETFREHFGKLLKIVLKNRYKTLCVFLLFLFFSLWFAVSKMSFVLFPSQIANEFIVDIELEEGVPLETSELKLKKVESLLLSLPETELESIRTRAGMGGDEFYQRLQSNKSMIMVNLTPFSSRERSAYNIVESLKKETDTYKEFVSIKYNVLAGGPPVGKAINIRVVGSDNELRKDLTDKMVAYMNTIPAIKDIKRNDDGGKKQIETVLDYEKISRLGLSVSDVSNTLRTAINGITATTVRYGEDDTKFLVKLDKNSQKSASFFKDIFVANKQNRLISMSDLMTTVEKDNQGLFYHFDGDRAVTVTAGLDKEILSPKKATKMIISHFDLKKWPGMSFVVGGESEETQESINDLLRTLILAVSGIYFLLVILFNSFAQPFLVIGILPFSILSVILILAVHNQPVAFISGIGLIGLMGVVVNDALVLLYRINRLRKENPKRNMYDCIIQGTSNRLRPIIVTSLTTIAGLLPLAYGIGGSDPFIAPMGLVLGYGLFFSTPIIVLLLPCLYAIFEDIKNINIIELLFYTKKVK